MDAQYFIHVLCLAATFGTTLLAPTTVSASTTLRPPTTHDPYCYCLDRPYMKSQEPFVIDDCTRCINCGEVQQLDCIVSCVNPKPEVQGDSICCPVCPDGPNCEAEGTIIKHGESIVVGHQLCECEPLGFGYDPRQSICYPLPPPFFP